MGVTNILYALKRPEYIARKVIHVWDVLALANTSQGLDMSAAICYLHHTDDGSR